MTIFQEKLEACGLNKLDYFFKALPDLPENPLTIRHIRVADRRKIIGLRRSIFKTDYLFCYVKEVANGSILPELNECMFVIDTFIIDDKGDLLGRIKPFGKYYSEGEKLLNDPDCFKKISFEPQFQTTNGWKRISSFTIKVK